MTANEICALDGSALTRLALRLGLAPESARDLQCESTKLTGLPILVRDALTGMSFDWRPHKNVSQADAVFRKLRTYGCCTMLTYTPQGGKAEAWCFPGGQSWQETFGEGAQEEALALLTVACIAAACLTYG